MKSLHSVTEISERNSTFAASIYLEIECESLGSLEDICDSPCRFQIKLKMHLNSRLSRPITVMSFAQVYSDIKGTINFSDHTDRQVRKLMVAGGLNACLASGRKD